MVIFYDNYVIIFDEEILKVWIVKLEKVLVFVFDIEIDSFDNIFVNLVGFFFVIELGVVVYILVVYDYFDAFD